MRSTLFPLICAAVLSSCWIDSGLVVAAERTSRDGDSKFDTIALTVKHDVKDLMDSIALVTVYHQGRAVRTAELVYDSTNSKTTWNLAAGHYEVHFESAKYPKFIKKIALSSDAFETTIWSFVNL